MPDLLERRDARPLQRRGLLAAGNWIVDHVKMIDRWPAQDTLATITSQSDGNGGGPYNVTKNLSRLGCGFPLSGIGLIGRDADGETILRDCDAHGIDRSAIRQTDEAPTSYTDVMTVGGSGRRTFFHQPGANALLNADHFDFAQTSARIFYLGYLGLLQRLDAVDEMARTAASRLLERARSLGMVAVADLVSGDTAQFASMIGPSLPHLDYLFLNEYELGGLTGQDASQCPAQLQSQARTVLQGGIQSAVIVHFPGGALWVSHSQPALTQPSVRVPADRIAGTAGAGDAFSAGFLLGLHEGWETQRCLRLGVCAAAASLRHATCSTAVESWRDCLALGDQLGFLPDLTIP